MNSAQMTVTRLAKGDVIATSGLYTLSGILDNNGGNLQLVGGGVTLGFWSIADSSYSFKKGTTGQVSGYELSWIDYNDFLGNGTNYVGDTGVDNSWNGYYKRNGDVFTWVRGQ